MSTALTAPVLPTYARQDVTFVTGEGSWLVDDAGGRYLDLVGGIAVVSLGHGHPAPLGVEPDVSGPTCAIRLDLGIGAGSASYLTSDLSYDYVRINADYRS